MLCLRFRERRHSLHFSFSSRRDEDRRRASEWQKKKGKDEWGNINKKAQGPVRLWTGALSCSTCMAMNRSSHARPACVDVLSYTGRGAYFSFGLRLSSKTQSAILAKGFWGLSSTANQMTPLPSMLLKQHVDWLELFMDRSKLLLFCFPFTEPGLCTNNDVFECAYLMDSERSARSNLQNLIILD